MAKNTNGNVNAPVTQQADAADAPAVGTAVTSTVTKEAPEVKYIHEGQFYQFQDGGTGLVHNAVGIGEGTILEWDITDPGFAACLKVVGGTGGPTSGLDSAAVTSLITKHINDITIDDENTAISATDGTKLIDANVVKKIANDISDMKKTINAIKKVSDAAAKQSDFDTLESTVAGHTNKLKTVITTAQLKAVSDVADAAVTPKGLKVVSDKLKDVEGTANDAATQTDFDSLVQRIDTMDTAVNGAATADSVKDLDDALKLVKATADAAATSDALKAVEKLAKAAATKIVVGNNSTNIGNNAKAIKANEDAIKLLQPAAPTAPATT